ncbi:hypothetical protein ACFRDV_39325 [Streptomyces fagopyri]|uniref:hypothetical protein n=1 Tax=Streptomyces fagopyri TaxID=2662397 RepID=UPI0036A5329B
MIEYVPYSSEPGAHSPAVICDTCRKQIVGEGLAVWRIKLRVKDEPRQQTPLYTTHKRECEQALHSQLNGQYPLDENWIDFSEEIDVFLKQLSKNINRSPIDDPDGS